MGTGLLRMIHSRVSWMCLPVERSITVSPPQRMAQVILSTSSPIEELTAELPMLQLIFTRKLRPMIIGSDSGWLMFAGMMARPRATSARTNSGVIGFSIFDFRFSIGSEPAWRKPRSFRHLAFGVGRSTFPPCSLIAMNSISDVMIPWRAYQSCVTVWPALPRRGFREPPNAERRTSNVELLSSPLPLSDFDVERWTLDVGRFLCACAACDSESQPSSIG